MSNIGVHDSNRDFLIFLMHLAIVVTDFIEYYFLSIRHLVNFTRSGCIVTVGPLQRNMIRNSSVSVIQQKDYRNQT